jgi:hypothetical protein
MGIFDISRFDSFIIVMSRCNLNYLLKYHSNCLHRLISKQFNDVYVVSRDKKSYIYSKNNNQIAWIWHTVRNTWFTSRPNWKLTRIYINKKLSYEYNETYIRVYVQEIGLTIGITSFGKKWMYISTPNDSHNIEENDQFTIINGVIYPLKSLSNDPIECIMKLYQWLLYGNEWAFLRTKMDAENIRYK